MSHHPLPTKTSQWSCQLTGKSWCFCRAFFQVFFIRFVYVLFLTIFVVAILLCVSRSLIFLNHLTFISLSVWVFSCMILSHCRTQIRWVDSERRICRRRMFAFCILVCRFPLIGFWWLRSFGMFRQPTSIIMPRLISGHAHVVVWPCSFC